MILIVKYSNLIFHLNFPNFHFLSLLIVLPSSVRLRRGLISCISNFYRYIYKMAKSPLNVL